MGKTLIVIGLVLVGLGVLWVYFPKALSWFGHLPGDIRYKSDNVTVFVPITSMIVVSVVLSLLARLFGGSR
ncbi:DUF2905 domain-containing protein [Deinococcus cellulosilyticus]|uniref:DUF2905 domain-containing protein n=1 Tax=Deinococcus cellulosilyticus (strain DSM 18568 / NBRC 106333 / KACC 11606 / 5516J-15) TaxID=1223518 RepID=A0A511N3H1_DEIC1|nr:DUF2905 domain-containing protein [Deinococcus cellulosilyticus]GEM47410.1 hypothetical protein DC3_30450 [Deinococcus cellulosilyticus NBRC 106333 = KACC 11606]